MAEFYNVTQYQKGNDWKSPHGVLESYFLDIEGHEGATIMTNKKPGNTPKLGQVYGELIFKKKGSKGQDVFQFKQVQEPDGVSTPTTPSTTGTATGNVSSTHTPSHIPEWFAPYAVMIKQIHEHLMTGTTPTVEAPTPVDDTLPGTNLSKAELEDIFGGSMEPVEIPTELED